MCESKKSPDGNNLITGCILFYAVERERVKAARHHHQRHHQRAIKQKFWLNLNQRQSVAVLAWLTSLPCRAHVSCGNSDRNRTAQWQSKVSREVRRNRWPFSFLSLSLTTFLLVSGFRFAGAVNKVESGCAHIVREQMADGIVRVRTTQLAVSLSALACFLSCPLKTIRQLTFAFINARFSGNVALVSSRAPGYSWCAVYWPPDKKNSGTVSELSPLTPVIQAIWRNVSKCRASFFQQLNRSSRTLKPYNFS